MNDVTKYDSLNGVKQKLMNQVDVCIMLTCLVLRRDWEGQQETSITRVERDLDVEPARKCGWKGLLHCTTRQVAVSRLVRCNLMSRQRVAAVQDLRRGHIRINRSDRLGLLSSSWTAGKYEDPIRLTASKKPITVRWITPPSSTELSWCIFRTLG